MRALTIIVAGLLLTALSCNTRFNQRYNSWPAYAGTKEGNRYSSTRQIDVKNVKRLKVAWTYSSHDKDAANRSQNQCNPVLVNNILYGVTPRLKLFALDAATGKEQWVFDPAKDESRKIDPSALAQVSRGVVYYEDAQQKNKRIFYSAGSRLYAVEAETGKLIKSFGEQGSIDLRKDLDTDRKIEQAYAAGTTPGVIYKDLLIMGVRLSEGADALPGHIRAFNVYTGKRSWIFHTIPQPGEFGYDTWEDKDAWKKIGGANNWSGMALDEKRGIVYVPTGSASPDFYGGTRKGQNLFANSIIALEAATGKYIWHYQVIHHDLWDRDLPANPNLITIEKNGKKIDALAQITKHGYIFLLDRTNGKPIFPINEVPVPQQALPGEMTWPTQPIPTLPEPFARQTMSEEEVTNITPEKHAEMLTQFRKVKNTVMFAPPSKEGGWIFPGFDGGGEWGGAAVDVKTSILYVNSSQMPWIQLMVDVPKKNTNDQSLKGVGKFVSEKYCVSCHGPALKGNGVSIPALTALEKKYNETSLRKLIENGRNMMPAMRTIPEGEMKALTAFLLNSQEKEAVPEVKRDVPESSNDAVKSSSESNLPAKDEIPFMMAGYNRFIDKDGYPGIKPPWGTLNAVNLTTGKLLWQVPLGEYEALTKKGIPITGTENYGGPLVTRGGLVFIAATKDEKIRAFDKHTGKQLWQADLPAAGFATPAMYTIKGKQYLVIACGGGKIGNKSGDSYVAFALE